MATTESLTGTAYTQQTVKAPLLRRFGTGLGVTLAVLALVVGAILWPGYDSVDTPPQNIEVWALNTSSSHYGQMNTAIREIEAVADATNLSTILQTGETAVVFTDGNRKFATVDQASPEDLTQEDTAALQPTPERTKSVSLGSNRILYVAADGALSTANLDAPGEALPLMVAAPEEEEEEEDEGTAEPSDTNSEEESSGLKTVPLRASAAAITLEDVVVALVRDSAEEQRVLRVDAYSGQILDEQRLMEPVSEDAQISQVQDKWVILDTAAEALWVEKQSAAIDVSLETGALLRAPGDGPIVVADSQGLLEWQSGTANKGTIGQGEADGDQQADQAQRIVTTLAGSAPARPTQVGDRVLAAWLTPGASGGTLWDSQDGQSTLAYRTSTSQDAELSGTPKPRIMVAGNDAILNDTVSGWAWTLPDGELIPTSQNWAADAQQETTSELSEVEEVDDQRAPVAVPDSFGVRPGQQTVLPVLLNDYDANRDVLSIDPGSVTGLDPEFGQLSLTNNNQQLVVEVSKDATGTASFMYAVTDGTSADGLVSAPARVTLTVAEPGQNSKPFFAGVGVQDYLGEWPNPSIAPGGTASAQVLADWIDPEGDPLFLASATTTSENALVLAQADGTVTVRHTDASGENLEPIVVTVTVADTRGAAESKDLVFKVRSDPPIEFTSAVVTTVVGNNLSIDLGEYVQGGQESLSIAEVNEPPGAESLRFTPREMNLNVTASEPGSYPLQVTVEDDGGNTAQQTIRVVVVAPEETRLGTWAATVFVRPAEDATIDLLEGVSNPAGSVLMITDLDLQPEGDAELSAEIVGQRYIHASGRASESSDRSPSGATLLGTGTYTVSDGSGNPAMSARGTVSFMMVEDRSDYPIATDRWIRVRAGDQVDVPVLEWAKAPAGAQLAIDQGSVSLAPTEGEDDRTSGLAFGTASSIRYLAPDEPGEYSVSYSIFPLGAPEFSSAATLGIRVIAADDDQIQAPKPLEARVLAGSTSTIPLNLSDAGMRGQTYVLDTVIDQPTLGTASVAPDGEALLYTAHPDVTGQDSFTYQVRGPGGQTALGTVLVGVLEVAAAPQPVLYSRYIQTPIGSQNRVSVFPLDNAEDPAGGELTLDEVWPNEVPGSPEFTAAEKRILLVDKETGEVRLEAAAHEGTTSFFYKAHNERGDQATGLIVTKAVKTPVELLPTVSDTRLTAETLRDLPSGVDVLEGKVTWVSGSASDLEMSLWDRDGKYSAKGAKISGPIPTSLEIVPFVVEGTSFSGESTRSYGFLKIPPPADVPVSLRSGFEAPGVPEGQEITIDLLEAIVDPSDKGLVFAPDKVETSGAREQATCQISGTTLTYDAGQGAPWKDACVIPVKAQNQESFTYLSLPIVVIPKEPQPVLLSANAEASPGRGAVQFDLTPMVDWQGGRHGKENFNITGSADLFEWTQNGSILTITADSKAIPTRSQTLSVSLVDYPEVPPGILTLTVGPAAGAAPRGGTAFASCSSEGGNTSCTFAVVNASVAGQVNYLPDEPLRLVEGSVVSPANCPGVKFVYHDETSVKATWDAQTPGLANCQGSFEVIDAQNRISQGMNRGTIMFELKGMPADPEVTWITAESDRVGFSVSQRGESYPKVDSVEWSSDSESGTCSLDGICSIPVSNSALGESKTYTFKAVSTAGSSTGTKVKAWSYRSPSKVRQATWYPRTEGASAVVSVEADSSDTGSLTVSSGGASKKVTVPPASTGTTGGTWTKVTFDVSASVADSVSVQITSNARLEHPPASVAVADAGKATETIDGVFAVGAPSITLEATATETGATATVRVDKDNGTESRFSTLEVELCAWVNGKSKGCVDSREMRVSAPAAAEVRFEAKARGKATSPEQSGKYFPATTEEMSVRVGVPAPLSGAGYRIDSRARECGLEGYELCYEWNQPDGTPTLGDLPAGASQVFSFDSFKHMYASLASALEAQGYVTNWPILEARNQVDAYASSSVSVRLDGPAPRRIAVRDPSDKECPLNMEPDFSPFSFWPTKFGTEERTTESEDDGTIVRVWKLRLKDGFTVEGRQDTISWTCKVLPEENDEDAEPEP